MRFCWAQYALWGVIATFGVMSMLAGCGAKGALELPPDEQAASVPAGASSSPPATTAPAASEQ